MGGVTLLVIIISIACPPQQAKRKEELLQDNLMKLSLKILKVTHSLSFFHGFKPIHIEDGFSFLSHYFYVIHLTSLSKINVPKCSGWRNPSNSYI